MNGFSIFVIAICGAMALEGVVYALFPGPMKRAMMQMQSMPENTLRVAGMMIAAIGLAFIYLLMPKT